MRYRWIWTLVDVILVAGLVSASTTTLALADDNDVVISEVSYNARCLGTDSATCGTTGSSNETRFEWVEIYNKSDTATVDLKDWEICDNRTSETCVKVSTSPLEVGPGQCWVIGHNSTATQTELDATGHGASFNSSRYIGLNSPIGNGLTNNISSGGTEEAVKLKNGSGTIIDCVSWKASSAGTVCGAEGVNTTLNNADQATSITNIQGTWYFHGPEASGSENQASPFNCNNTAADGSPTVITLSSFTAHNGHSVALASPSHRPAVSLVVVGLMAVGAGLAALRRRPTL